MTGALKKYSVHAKKERPIKEIFISKLFKKNNNLRQYRAIISLTLMYRCEVWMMMAQVV